MGLNWSIITDGYPLAHRERGTGIRLVGIVNQV